MGNLYNNWSNFWKTIPEIGKILEQPAKRSGLSVEAALLLLALYEHPDTEILINENLKKELCDKGIAEYTEKSLKINSKGAILGKSFKGMLEKY